MGVIWRWEQNDDALRAPIAESVSRLGIISDDRWIGKTIGAFLVTERIAAGGIVGCGADSVVHRKTEVTPLEHALCESGIQHALDAPVDHDILLNSVQGRMPE